MWFMNYDTGSKSRLLQRWAKVDVTLPPLLDSLCLPTHLQTDPVLSDVGALHAGRIGLYRLWSFAGQASFQMGAPGKRHDVVSSCNSNPPM